MANKKFLLGALVTVLVFGMSVIGCPNDDDSANGNGGDKSLNGTWDSQEAGGISYTFDNGNFQATMSGLLYAKGTYKAEGGKITLTPTHWHGQFLNNRMGSDDITFESKWYSKSELKAFYKTAVPDEEFDDAEFDAYFFSTLTANYSISGSTLTLTFDGYTTKFTKRS
jgi:hypothetical protein